MIEFIKYIWLKMIEFIKYIWRLPGNIKKALLLALVTFISGSLFVGLLNNLFDVLTEKTKPPDFTLEISIGIMFIIFLFSFLYVYRERNIFLNSYALFKIESRPHKCVIAIVSNLKDSFIENNADSTWKIKNKKDGKEVLLKGENINDDINEIDKNGIRWNWQQLMRCILPHEKSLGILYLIGSSGSEGSYKNLDDAGELISRYIKGLEVIKIDKGVDFEDFDELVKCINDAINKLKGRGVQDKDIIIDITGGQKTASIAGAVITLNKKINFQYVATNPDPVTGKYKVWEYNTAVESSFPSV